ncbi:MAG: TonB-dependent receptor family protein [Bacteroidota bacterium]|nr:TonB-dependent receptor family protein [Bacteroidota bacterium]
MKKFFLLLLSLFIFKGVLNAQQNKQEPSLSINGTIKDEQEKPVPYASVALYSSIDSVFITGTASDLEGKYTVSAIKGNYFIKITFLSFEEKIIRNIDLKDDGIKLGKIILKPSSVALEEFEIISEKSQMQLQLDKRVFNVGTDLSNKGGNAAEVLENVPSVSVDIDGNVGLRGSQNVRILIDGKPSGLTGISSSDALRQLPANMIESVEIITNPSARYEAEGEVGIINIVLKKEKRSGLNGAFEANAGYPDNYGGSFNINLRKKSINLFSSYGINYRKNPGNGSSYRQFTTNDTTFSYQNDRIHERTGLSQNIRIGSDFFINESNTLTVSGLYKNSNGNNNTRLIYSDYNQYKELTQTVVRTDVENEIDHTIEAALTYLKTYSQKGRKWTVDMKFIQSDDTELSNITEKIDAELFQINQRSGNTEDEQNLLFQTDYIHPFGKNGKFETGLRSTLRTISNEYLVEEQNKEGDWFKLMDFNNHFIYNENIHSGYTMAGTKIKKTSFQGGIRAEYSEITTKLVKTQVINSRNYLSLFPSAHISYELDSTNTLQLSYSRRLSRPRFRELLPFFTFSDSRNFYSGNPDLNPEFTNSFELGHLKYFEKGSVLSSMYYRYRTGVVERITIADSTGFTRFFPVNLSTQHAYGLEFNMNYKFNSWWQANGNFNFYRAITEGVYEQQSLYSDTYTWTARASSKFSIKKKVDAQTSLNYRAPQETTQGKTKSMYSIDIGLSKTVLKGNGTLTLSARDLLNSRKRRSITYSEGYYAESEFQWMTRQIMLSFNYRLNQKNSRNNSEKKGSYSSDDDSGF